MGTHVFDFTTSGFYSARMDTTVPPWIKALLAPTLQLSTDQLEAAAAAMSKASAVLARRRSPEDHPVASVEPASFAASLIQAGSPERSA